MIKTLTRALAIYRQVMSVSGGKRWHQERKREHAPPDGAKRSRPLRFKQGLTASSGTFLPL
jgi:hypothetical protein